MDAYQTLTETGGSIFPAAPEQLFLQMGGNDLISELGIPLDPSVLAPQYRYVAITYRDPSCSPFGCPRGLVQMTIDSITLVPSEPDGDGDGVADNIAALDGNGDPIPGSFDDGDGTFGTIVSGSGLLVENVLPEGVRITTTDTEVTVRMCGLVNVRLSPGSDVTLTCGSVTAQVVSGQATVELGATGSVIIPVGGEATIDRLTSGDYSVTNNGTTSVIVTRSGVTTSISGGTTTYSAPQTREHCKKDGWRAYGTFIDQGACISFVSTRR